MVSVKTFQAKDLMVPLSEYASVAEDATLFDAFLALERAQEDFDHTKYRHLGVLVMDARQRVVGKLNTMDALRALEATRQGVAEVREIERFGFSPAFVRWLQANVRAKGAPLEQTCAQAARLRAGDFMEYAAEDGFIDEQAPLKDAIPALIMGRHISLLVRRGEEIVGVLRQSDVFAAVFHLMKACDINGGAA
jgi:hypothetical protein